jgi:anti-anti-sigma regulatory factor
LITLQTGPSYLIRLDGEITLACADELKRALLSWLQENKDLELDLQNAAEVDLTALQLLFAAAREAARRGQNIVARTSLPVRDAARDAGFGDMPGFSPGDK